MIYFIGIIWFVVPVLLGLAIYLLFRNFKSGVKKIDDIIN